MKLLQNQVQGLYRTLSQTQLKEQDEWEKWNYIDLGMICLGVKNGEGYSKVFLEIGCDPNNDIDNKYEIVRLTHKFYFSNQSHHHHSYNEYWEWTGNVYDYIKDIKRQIGKNDKSTN